MSHFKKSKNCFYGTYLCAIIFLITCIFLLIHVYECRQSNSYQQDLVMNSNIQTIDGGMDSSNNEGFPDNDTKLEKANHKVEKPVDARVQDTKSFRQQNLLHKPDHTTKKQTNATTDLDSGTITTRVKRPVVEATSHEKEPNIADLGINSTHVNGILMESVNTELLRNVYFTIKTTRKYYRSRLLPLMLTWLQAVNKNKVRLIIIISYILVISTESALCIDNNEKYVVSNTNSIRDL